MRIHVEFLGLSRLITGLKEMSFSLEEGASFRNLVESLGKSYPALIGDVIQPLQNDLQIPNRFLFNGGRFLQQNEMGDKLNDGDRVVLMSISAGG